MKFTNIILSLITATSVFSKTLYKKEEALELFSVTECDEAIKKECNLEITKDNLDTLCKAYQSDKCQKLIKDGIASIPACKILGKDFILLEEKSIKFHSARVEFMCTRDEKGNNCPYTNFELKYFDTFKNEMDNISNSTNNTSITKEINKNEDTLKEDEEEEKEAIKAIDETCKSNNCSEALIKLFTYMQSFEKDFKTNFLLKKKRNFKLEDKMDEDEKIITIIDHLKSKECLSKRGLQYSISNANIIEYNISLITISSLLIYIFLIL